MQAAVAHELPVASPRWIFESFRAQKLLDAQDFGLKLLEGMGICTAGLTVEEKETVEQLATTHGAQYDGRLELGFTSVLIAQVTGCRSCWCNDIERCRADMSAAILCVFL